MEHSKHVMDALHRAVEALKAYDRRTNHPMAYSDMAGVVLEALSTPEFVLPLAEKMLREKRVYEVCLSSLGTSALRSTDGVCLAIEDTLLDAYRAEKGE
jgi:hypothetical protein